LPKKEKLAQKEYEDGQRLMGQNMIKIRNLHF